MTKQVNFTQTDIINSAAALGYSASFQKALGFTLPQEGIVFENVPGDDGGATCCGITQADYDSYRDQVILPRRSVGEITPREIAGCYWRHYWHPLGCDGWTWEVAVVMFDTAVNVGIGQAVKFLQRSICVTPVDGCLGPATEEAEHNWVVVHGADALASNILMVRRVFYSTLALEHKNDEQFLDGWTQRCKDLAAAVGVTL